VQQALTGRSAAGQRRYDLSDTTPARLKPEAPEGGTAGHEVNRAKPLTSLHYIEHR
jgi:hypothetical protein